MGWSLLVAIIVVLAVAATLLLRYRRQRRLVPTQHVVKCPVNDCAATLVVDSDPLAAPSSRHVDVRACSLMPPTSFVPPAREAYFADMAPPAPYLEDVGLAPQHSAEVSCAKSCLYVLNAAENGARREPIPCASGVSDAPALAEQTQSSAMKRIIWFFNS